MSADQANQIENNPTDPTDLADPSAASLPLQEAQTEVLTQVTPGRVVRVIELGLTDERADRLKSLGLCVGRRVQVIQQGDPLIILAAGARLGVSGRLAEHVQVELCPHCAPTDRV